MTTFTPTRPYLKALADDHGRTWQFAYWGSGFIYIREMIDSPDLDDMIIPIGERASRDDWPYLIGIGDYIGMTPEKVTARWVDERTASWVADRSDEAPDLTP